MHFPTEPFDEISVCIKFTTPVWKTNQLTPEFPYEFGISRKNKEIEAPYMPQSLFWQKQSQSSPQRSPMVSTTHT